MVLLTRMPSFSNIFKIVFTVFFVSLLFWVVLANRGDVSFSLSPIIPEFSVPLALIVFASVLFGFVWGMVIIWLNGSDLRRNYRLQKRALAESSSTKGN